MTVTKTVMHVIRDACANKTPFRIGTPESLGKAQALRFRLTTGARFPLPQTTWAKKM